jgi:hypothetical protein
MHLTIEDDSHWFHFTALNVFRYFALEENFITRHLLEPVFILAHLPNSKIEEHAQVVLLQVLQLYLANEDLPSTNLVL